MSKNGMWMGYSCVLLEDNLNETDRRGVICHNFRILMGQGDYCNEMFYRPTMGYWDSGMIVTTKNSCLVTQWEFHGMLWGLIFNVFSVDNDIPFFLRTSVQIINVLRF